MPSAIDSSFIGAGPVNKAAFATQLDTAEAEITALQAATIESRAVFNITAPVAAIRINVPTTARTIRYHLSGMQLSVATGVRMRFRRGGQPDDDLLSTDYYTMAIINQASGVPVFVNQDDSWITILPTCGEVNQGNTAEGAISSAPGSAPSVSGSFYSNSSINNSVGVSGGRLKRVGAIDRITFLLSPTSNFLAGNIYLEWRA
jgi:hypothetical protein